MKKNGKEIAAVCIVIILIGVVVVTIASFTCEC